MRAKLTRSAATTQQGTEAVSDFCLLPRLIQVSINGGGRCRAAGFLGRLHGAKGADCGRNIGRVVQLNRCHQALASTLGISGIRR